MTTSPASVPNNNAMNGAARTAAARNAARNRPKLDPWLTGEAQRAVGVEADVQAVVSRHPLRLRWQSRHVRPRLGRSQRRTMTFCTACASPLATPTQSCPTCGALHPFALDVPGSRFVGDTP